MKAFHKVYGVLREKSFWKEVTSDVLLYAVLTAVLVFATTLLARIEGGNVTFVMVLSAVLSALISFVSTLLRFLKDEEDSNS